MQPQAGESDVREVRYQNAPGILQIINDRVLRIRPTAGGAKFCQIGLIIFQTFQNCRSCPGARIKIQAVRLKFPVRSGIARSNRGEGRSPRDEVNVFGFILQPFDPRTGSRVVVLRVPPLAGVSLFKPGLDERRGREILLVGQRLGNKCAVVKLLAARLQFPPVAVPGATAAPVFLGAIQREQRDKAGQHKQATADHSPTKQPAEQPTKGWKMAAGGLSFGIIHAN
ncbi:MAG TPA: hypothetical protein VEL06_05860 [Haliangiales bacterium]|nr:hypothetical protein [Haliangiales bacterium]